MKFSPGKVEKILITLRIAEDFLEKIDREASRRDLSRNEFICQAIAYAMDNMDSSEEEYPPRHGLKEENISSTKPKEKNKTDLPTT